MRALLERLAQRNGEAAAPCITPAALQLLGRYEFPGNVRELENILERAMTLYPGPTLEAESIQLPSMEADAPDREQLEQLPKRNRWNQSRSAREMGWTLAKLRYWTQQLGLD